MAVSNPRRPDNPLEAVNAAFLSLTGYSEREVVGRDCRFLTGPDTEPWLSAEIRSAIENAARSWFVFATIGRTIRRF